MGEGGAAGGVSEEDAIELCQATGEDARLRRIQMHHRRREVNEARRDVEKGGAAWSGGGHR